MTRTVSESFHALTAKGAPIQTFDDMERARAWAKEKATTFPGLIVKRVTITTTVESAVVYTPRPRLVSETELEVPSFPDVRRAG